MKNIEKWFAEKGIKYDIYQYGNPYYFNDGFSVAGINVAFHYDNIGNEYNLRYELERYMKKKKSCVCIPYNFGGGIAYHIHTVFDYRRLVEHEERVQNATEAFWQAEHARRIAASQQARA